MWTEHSGRAHRCCTPSELQLSQLACLLRVSGYFSQKLTSEMLAWRGLFKQTQQIRDEKNLQQTRCTYFKILDYIFLYNSLLTGRLFCDVLGCGGGGVGSWLSSFLERTSLKRVRMTETLHRYWSCLVTSGIDSFRLQNGGKNRQRGGTVGFSWHYSFNKGELISFSGTRQPDYVF